MHTKEQIAEAIKHLPNLDEDALAHNFKCASSTKSAIYKPFMEAVEKELRKRRKSLEQESDVINLLAEQDDSWQHS